KVQAIYLWWHKPVIDRELLQSPPNLKVIANSGVGMDHLDLKLVGSFGMKMANAPHAVCSATADTGMALLLAAARRLVGGNISILFGAEQGYIESWKILSWKGPTRLIEAWAYSWKLKCIGAELGHLRGIRGKVQEEQVVSTTYCEKMDSLLQQADFVMLAVSLTPQTHRLIGKTELEIMKPTAILINISRGTI
ncbi:GRHPR reductase, partial [Peucedramus taeniatus]|nr:GRHPR reductase [Peucedramus taeniatus]